MELMKQFAMHEANAWMKQRSIADTGQRTLWRAKMEFSAGTLASKIRFFCKEGFESHSFA